MSKTESEKVFWNGALFFLLYFMPKLIVIFKAIGVYEELRFFGAIEK